ncbi:hypothetical protein FNF28_02251 [Cafeteria roenbergensis]|uniref:Fatty acid hydroxylase domain-containing protein n=1 Tax=Cafeteria roenbergensis TaxID=33653 RepID=A0A5A8DXJ7_CAFRO|nr:hypothetical protein FNF28_02251 [Cafeteria roenbergensis]
MSETAAFPFPALSAFADGPLADAASWAWDSLDRDIATMPEGLRPFAESNDWKNALVLPVSVRDQMPRVLASWLRNLVAGSALYYVLGLVWCALIYGCFRSRIFPKGGVPTLSAQLAQIWVSQKALVMYTLMPTIGEWLAENGLSRCYYSIEEIGGIVPYLAWTALYLFLIEFCVYWASPYVFLLVLIPVHFWTFMVMLFATAMWTTNIHDTLVGKTEPVMGSAYHTLHHTDWVYNYGQYFIFFDWLFGTLLVPEYPKLGLSLQGSWAEQDAAEAKAKAKAE